jgi:hypothetical protein
MAYNQDSGLDFRPFRPGDFNHRTPIHLGGHATTPYHKGVADLAYNQLTLWGQIGNPVILHAADPTNSTVTLTAASTNYDIAAYWFPVPSFVNATAGSGRRYISVSVRGYVSSGTWLIRGKTSVGTGTAASTGNTTSSVITFDVPIPEGPVEEYFILTVNGNTAGATFTFQSITAVIKPITTAALGTGGAIYNQDAFHPVDSTAQIDADMPLTVDTAKSLALSNKEMYRTNVRQVVNYCQLANYGTLWAAQASATAGRYIQLSEQETAGYRRAWQWLYFPRPGVTTLKVHVDGYVVGWASSVDNCLLDCSLRDLNTGEKVGESATLTLNSASYFDASAWATGTITGFTGGGPYYIDLRARIFSATGEQARITAVSIFERWP